MKRTPFLVPGKRECSIFCTIFSTLLVVLIVEVFLLYSSIHLSSVDKQLHQNAIDILDKQVENRASYINGQFSQIRELTDISTTINNTTQKLLDNGSLDLHTLDQGSENSLPLLDAILPNLIDALRSRPATGIFVVLNTHDLAKRELGSPIPCLYLRDLDPDAVPPKRNTDLLLERAPAQIVQHYTISTDKGWTPSILYRGSGGGGFLQLPFETAYLAQTKLDAREYGRLISVPYTLSGDSRSAIAYSQPLILEDGTVYGVIGVELLTSYLETRLPSIELQNNNAGFYLLASTTDTIDKSDTLTLKSVVFSSASADAEEMDDSIVLHREGKAWYFDQNGTRQYAALREIEMYSRNAPFSNEHWVLVGAVNADALFSFSDSINHILIAAIAATIAVGLLASYIASRTLAKPVAQLSQELAAAQSQNGKDRVPEFSRTGIRELDQLAAAITQLTRENLAASALERIRIERERDHDLLTGLYNRQAFRRSCEGLFATPDRLGHAALVMMDLDNLKHINDGYGHDYGDQYLRQTGRCLMANTPPGTLCSRLSGDEFILLFYGYESQDAIRQKLAALREAMSKSVLSLPDGTALHIGISGGIAWYPESSTNYNTLKKYADFALYQVKQSDKGHLCEFDLEQYNQKTYALQIRQEFEQMIHTEKVLYHFQPIYAANTGRVVAYEALMRVPDFPALRSPATVMKLANEQNRLYDIERITLFKASERFEWLRQNRRIRYDAMLFINSIASVSLSDLDWDEYVKTHAALLGQLVVEITEEEQLNLEALERKRNVPGSRGIFALDDYGSGYSNGSSLLSLSPRYVKVDISIIRNIDTDPDKQRFLTSLIEYARPYGIKVLAEGVETLEELHTVLALGVDLLQGYCLAKPAAIPSAIDPKALDVIQKYHAEFSDF